jgi:hypothetical protein
MLGGVIDSRHKVASHDDAQTGRNDPHASPLRQDVAALLRIIADKWAEYDRDELTDAQNKALYALIAAGLVERRGWLRIAFAGHGESFEVRYQATGEAGMAAALASAVSEMFLAWQDAWTRWTKSEASSGVPFVAESLKPQEWRLTSEGVTARSDLTDNPNMVIDFVLKTGFYGSGYRHRAFITSLPTLDAGAIAERSSGPNQTAEDTRPPVEGTGTLVEIRRRKRAAEPSNVAVTNWAEGADSFAQLLAPMFDALSRQTADAQQAEGFPVAENPSAIAQRDKRDKRDKRGSAKGEAEAKLIAALALHHKYSDGSCLTLEPVKNNALARLAGVDQGSASHFFKKHFRGRQRYARICDDPALLARILGSLVGDMPAWKLFGRAPASEGGRAEDD